MDPALDRMKVTRSDEVEHKLNALGVPYTTHGSPDSNSQIDANRREQFEAIERWFHHEWMRIEQKLLTSIVEGISVFLSLFDDSPAVKRTFCPPNFPVASNPGLAKAIIVFLKQDFQRSCSAASPRCKPPPTRTGAR
jgi:hypothetical protein